MVLQEHDWNAEDALQVLQMFSDPGANTTAFNSIFSLMTFISWFGYLFNSAAAGCPVTLGT